MNPLGNVLNAVLRRPPPRPDIGDELAEDEREAREAAASVELLRARVAGMRATVEASLAEGDNGR